MALEDEKYMLLTTSRRNGTPVATPVWLTPLANRDVGFWTSSASGKAKRLAHTAAITVQPCDARGRLKAGTTATGGTARIVTGPELDTIRRGIVSKYGFMTKVTKLLATLGGIAKRKRTPYGDVGVIVTLVD